MLGFFFRDFSAVVNIVEERRLAQLQLTQTSTGAEMNECLLAGSAVKKVSRKEKQQNGDDSDEKIKAVALAEPVSIGHLLQAGQKPVHVCVCVCDHLASNTFVNGVKWAQERRWTQRRRSPLPTLIPPQGRDKEGKLCPPIQPSFHHS